jgi:hypothetical protein
MELSVYTAAGLGPWFTTGVNVNSSVAISVAMHRDDLSLTRRHNCLDNISQNFTLTMQLFHYTSLAELWSTELYMHLKHYTAPIVMQWRQDREAEREAQAQHNEQDTIMRYQATGLKYGTTAEFIRCQCVMCGTSSPAGHTCTRTLLLKNRMAQTAWLQCYRHHMLQTTAAQPGGLTRSKNEVDEVDSSRVYCTMYDLK